MFLILQQSWSLGNWDFFDASLCSKKMCLSQGSQGLPGVPGARGKAGPLVSNQASSASQSPFLKVPCPAGKTAWQGCAVLNRKPGSQEPAHFSPRFSDFCRVKSVTKDRLGFQDHLALRYVPPTTSFLHPSLLCWDMREREW